MQSAPSVKRHSHLYCSITKRSCLGSSPFPPMLKNFALLIHDNLVNSTFYFQSLLGKYSVNSHFSPHAFSFPSPQRGSVFHGEEHFFYKTQIISERNALKPWSFTRKCPSVDGDRCVSPVWSAQGCPAQARSGDLPANGQPTGGARGVGRTSLPGNRHEFTNSSQEVHEHTGRAKWELKPP